MTANELADINEWSCCAHSKEVSAMLRQQQAEIEALKQIIDANNLSQNIGQFVKPTNEPVAYVDPIWMQRADLVMAHQLEIGKLFARTQFKNYVPLYTHQYERPHNTVLVPCDKLAEMQAEIKALKAHPVKELTDEEIKHIQAQCHLKDVGYDGFIMRFARAILRKVHEK